MELYELFIWMGLALALLTIAVVVGTAVERVLRHREMIKRHKKYIGNARLEEYNETERRR